MPDRKARNRGYGYGSYGCDGDVGPRRTRRWRFFYDAHGTESVAYRFRGRRDGWHRSARLVAEGTTLFCTTDNGGGNGCEVHRGCGTIFALPVPTQKR